MNEDQQTTVNHMVSRFKNERGAVATYEVRMSGKFAYVQFHVKTPNPFPELRVGPKAGWWSDAQCRGGEIRTFPNPAMDSLLYADELLAKQDTICRRKVTRRDAHATKPKTTCQTVTLDRAYRAVKAYNEGLDGRGVKNANLDILAHGAFAHGLGSKSGDIEQQVYFIGKDYGGVAGRPSAINLAPAIAHDIFEIREEYERTASSVVSLLSQVADRSTIEFLFRPFVQTIVDKNGRETKNWLVWAAKFWHRLNPDAFPIESSETDEFFELGNYNSQLDRYMKLLNKFRAFVLSRQEWLSYLRQADGGVDGEVDGKPVCSDNKLWDKMIMGLKELDKAGK